MTIVRRYHPTAYAVVLPPPDGRNILTDPRLALYAYGTWPGGFPGQVVGVIVDAGTGATEAEIMAALTVTALDDAGLFGAVHGMAVGHMWSELDRLRADAERASEDDDNDPLQGYSPDEIVVGAGGQTLAQAAAKE